MNDVIEKIKDLNLNIDSQSTVEIANAYIQYMYFDSILGFTLLTLILYGVYKLFMKMLDD